jgi:hypothetical protein
LRGVEHAANRAGIGDVGLDGERPAAFALDLTGERLGGFCAGRIVDDDGEAPVARRSATAAPIPREAPVTIATLLVLSVMSSPCRDVAPFIDARLTSLSSLCDA